jgi:hypothetical protein
LGMTSTVTDPKAPGIPVAKCYRSVAPDTFVAIPAEVGELAGPAGSMLTTSTDAAKWLVAMLGEGRAGAQQVFPKRAVRIVQAAQTTQKRRFRYFDRFAWGLGEDLGEYEGDLIVHRFGGLNGAYSHVSFMPERGIGVAAFSNGGGAVPDAVAAFAYDLLLDKKGLEQKWSAELDKVAAAVANDREQRRKAAAATADARRPLPGPAQSYVASYHADRLGDIAVTADGGRLYGQLGIYRAELIPTGGDGFVVDWTGEGEAMPIKFVPERIDWGGRIFERVP